MTHSGSSDRYRLIESVYQRAADVPRAERGRFLREACGEDQALRLEIETLLGHYDVAPRGFLETPVHALADRRANLDAVPDRIGGYAIIGLLGRGGMGAVYEAQQAQPARRVALKMIRADALSDDAQRRFRHEADALARLRHPGIGQIYEFGAGEVWYNGVPTHAQPFLVMELAHGKPLNEYVAAARPDRPALLDLIARICDAVHHAHQKGVIHRDLKPGNIVVDEEGRPKVLDFGVARIAAPDWQTQAGLTAPGQLVGTIPYMSPEHVGGDPHAVDTRSDVFALGVIAYELLVGRLPFDVAGLPAPQALRIVAENEPRRAASARPELAGDLDAILGKALERQPERRYASAAEFAADLRRCVRHEPVAARPPTLVYQFRKFARRNRGLVLGASLLLVALLAGAAGTATFAWREQRQSRSVRAQAARAEAVIDLLRDMILSVDPSVSLGDDITIRRMLDETVARLDAGKLAPEPPIQATLRSTIGEAYSQLGLYESACRQLRASLDLWSPLPGAHAFEVIRAQTCLAEALTGLNDLETAESLARQALSAAQKLYGEAHWLVARATGDLGYICSRLARNKEAEAHYRLALELWRRLPGSYERETAQSLSNLGALLLELDRLDEAEPLLREALDRRRVLLPATHPGLAYSLNNLGMLLRARGRLEEAEPLLREALEIRRRALEPGHPELGKSLHNLAQVLEARGRTAEALPLYQEACENQELALGPDHPDLGVALFGLAGALSRSGDSLAALRQGQRGLAILRNAVAGAHPMLIGPLNNLAVFHLDVGDAASAEPLLREAEEIARTALGPDDPVTTQVRETLALGLIRSERYQEAADLLVWVVEQHRNTHGDRSDVVAIALGKLALAQLRAGNLAAASETAAAALDRLPDAPELSGDRAVVLQTRAEAMLGLDEGPPDPSIGEALAAARAIFCERNAERSWQACDAARVEALRLLRAGRIADAQRLLQSALADLDAIAHPMGVMHAQTRARVDAALRALPESAEQPIGEDR